MIEEYQSFYDRAHEIIERVKKQKEVKKTYNDSNLYNDFYITCIPWLSIEGMTHPLIDNDYASLSCPRICWDKFHQEGDKIFDDVEYYCKSLFCRWLSVISSI